MIRIVIALCITEALLTVLQHYLFAELYSIAAVTLHIFMFSLAASLIIYKELSKETQKIAGISQNYNGYYKFAIDQHSIVATTDIKGIIQDVNDKFCEISGYERDELIGQDHRIINSGIKDKTYWRDMYRTVAKGDIWKDEVRNRAKNGEYYWVDTTIIPLMNDKGKPESYISIRTDITKQKEIQKEFEKANEKLKKLTQIDELTGISNRRSYEKQLELEIQTAQRTNQPLSILVIDIDNFKVVNDTYGHDTGDIVLRQVADTINKTLTRTTDFVSRFGGEEFIVLMPSTDSTGAYRVAERIRKNIAKIEIAAPQSNSQDHITISTGVATQTGILLDKNQLFKQADTALYKAKESGKNKTVTYQSEKDETLASL
jgi:diguanylate cyclase (GGDEF)-like protein/PAS domain S-box-containing protein